MVKLADEVVKRYYELEKSIIAKIGNSPFPKTGDVDSADIVMMVMNYFMNCDGNYYPTIKCLLPFTNVTTDQLDQVYPDITTFLDWLIDVLKKQ